MPLGHVDDIHMRIAPLRRAVYNLHLSLRASIGERSAMLAQAAHGIDLSYLELIPSALEWPDADAEDVVALARSLGD